MTSGGGGQKFDRTKTPTAPPIDGAIRLAVPMPAL
jgi:hypothetical protein